MQIQVMMVNPLLASAEFTFRTDGTGRDDAVIKRALNGLGSAVGDPWCADPHQKSNRTFLITGEPNIRALLQQLDAHQHFKVAEELMKKYVNPPSPIPDTTSESN